MITWSISRTPITTRVTSVVESTLFSYTFTASNADPGGTQTAVISSYSTSFDYRYTSFGSDGVSTFRSTFSSFTYFEEVGRTYPEDANPEGQEPPFEQIADNNYESDATLSVQPFLTYSQTTSTTATLQSISTVLGTIEGLSTAFVTTLDEENPTLSVITEVEVPTTIWAALQQAYESTVDSTTTINSTYSAATHATVAQAVTTDALKAVVIYSRTAPEEWIEYSPATDGAQSATRATFEPLVSTSAIATGTPPPTTDELIVEAITTTATWSATLAEDIDATTVDFGQLPNLTGEQNSTRVVTQGINANYTVRAAATLTFGNIGFAATSWSTTSEIKSHGTYGVAVQRYSASVPYETTIVSTMTYLQTVTTPVFLSAGGADETVLNAPGEFATIGQTSRTLKAAGVEGQTTVFGPLQVGTTRGNVGRSRYVTAGAVIGDQIGGWFTADAGTIYTSDTKYGNYTALDGAGPRGLTLFPQTRDFITIESNSFTWATTAEVGSQTVRSSSSAVVGVAGSPRTINDPVAADGSVRFGAIGNVERGATIVQQAAIGAYKDIAANEGSMIIGPNGVTTSFNGDASIITEGEVSQGIHSWQPILALSPAIQRTNRSVLTWTEFRNDTAEPPMLDRAL